ncbi:Structural maintenance of chromosomes 5 [Hyphodiscus hymeniophilus]|uniref:Structural maintenance of chromosomes protein 5 n=1 Tax=Hyphodiscus hymeniophilus TaxID=353542 RepID=A0A9P6VPM8_9HELO|nr:Structural maintenance of chromosomes 5 [Hyphodiscus hymeniophilus]
MSSPIPQRRRRADIEDDDEPTASHGTPPSESSKRARTNGYRSSPSPDPEDFDSPHPQTGRHANINGLADEDENMVGHNEFQPGAIVRVKLTNFVTYENAEFFPGPNLNMVIGPNGTGKSSLVCAICLGLGWGAKHLGRAGEVGEFVKHGMADAQIEIELQRRRKEPLNHVIRSRIVRDGNSREWWLNNKKTSLKAVQELTRSLSIQIDNLCQFLPQDKVSEFAALTPVELLQQTQRAAAPEEMLDWHNSLKKYRKEQKESEMQNTSDKEQLENLQARQDGLRAEVSRLKERNEIQKKVAMLKKTRPFVEYRHALNEHREFKARKKAAQARLKRLEARLGPTLKSIERKKELEHQTSMVVNERKKYLHNAEKAADKCFSEIEQMDEGITTIDHKTSAERKLAKDAKAKLLQLEKKLADLKVKANREPIVFDSVEYNDRIRAKRHAIEEIESEAREVGKRIEQLKEEGRNKKALIEAAKDRLAAFDTQEGKQMNKLEGVSRDTAIAWKWIQDNMALFEKTIYGPAIVSCSLKDQKYANVVEAGLSKADFLTITVQTAKDHEKLSEHLLGTMKLSDVTIRKSDEESVPKHPFIAANDMLALGLEGWASDLIDGPVPVLSMLCFSANINTTAVGLGETNDDQHSKIVANNSIRSWNTGRFASRVTRRLEYGPSATSTSTKPIRPARFWTDQPVDSGAKGQQQNDLTKLEADFAKLKEEVTPLRSSIETFKSSIKETKEEIDQIQHEKGELQRAQGEQKALPDKIALEERVIGEQQDKIAKIYENITKFGLQQDLAYQRKANKALEYKEKVEGLRSCHETLLEAEIRLIEAKSDVETLQERNSDIVQRQEQERQQVSETERESKIRTQRAKRALEVCEAVLAEGDDETNKELQNIPENLTMEALELDIASEESKLDFIQANNPNAIAQFERFQTTVDRLAAKVEEADKKLEKIQDKIDKVRGRWEPELDKLISEISDAFSYNFEQIGCAGEVGVEKTDDFEDWAIKIKVKFRENEQLQVLDKHRQSGGERSVSTIFYLMALQSLARSPFRVVDEINQGMDPRNERMVHERMVQIACQEHTSQYFLITPKLLTGLRYDRRMKVLCIASGEYMPQDYRQLDVRQIISLRRTIVGAA